MICSIDGLGGLYYVDYWILECFEHAFQSLLKIRLFSLHSWSLHWNTYHSNIGVRARSSWITHVYLISFGWSNVKRFAQEVDTKTRESWQLCGDIQRDSGHCWVVHQPTSPPSNWSFLGMGMCRPDPLHHEQQYKFNPSLFRTVGNCRVMGLTTITTTTLSILYRLATAIRDGMHCYSTLILH